MTYEDYRQRVEVFQTNQLLLDYAFVKLAEAGDVFVKTGERDEKGIDSLLSSIDQLVVSALMDNITVLTLAMVLIKEGFIIPPAETTLGILSNVDEVLAYCERFPIMETLQRYMDGKMSNVEVEELIKFAPPIKVNILDTLSEQDEQVYHQHVSSIKEVLSKDPLLGTSATDILAVSELTADSFDKIGVATAMPEMVIARFIINYTNIYVSLVNTIAIFTTKHVK